MSKPIAAKPLTHFLDLKHSVDLAVEQFDYGVRGPGRREQADPAATDHVRIPRFRRRWHPGGVRRALVVGKGDRVKLAGAYKRCGATPWRPQHLDLPADHVID